MRRPTDRDQQRRELGEFVRAQREKLAPASIGLPGVSRRRTPGLRREEVAQLSGMSSTWYTWIEQGREVSVSAAALARLAGALRLGRAEGAYLFALAGKRDPRLESEADALPDAVARCIAEIAAPAYILDRSWRARSWNAAAERLFVGWLDRPEHDPKKWTPVLGKDHAQANNSERDDDSKINHLAPGDRSLLRFIFLEPSSRSLICEWEERARRVVAEFRAARGAHLDDADLQRLLTDLRRASAEFARFWDEHAVLGREGGERTFNHPERGFLRYEQVTFSLAGSAEFSLTVLVEAAGAL